MPSRPTPGDHRAVPPTVGIRRRPVTGRTQLNAVGDKSPYSLIPSSARRVHLPDADDILAPRQRLAAYPRFRHWAGSGRRSITFYCVRVMMPVSGTRPAGLPAHQIGTFTCFGRPRGPLWFG